MGQKAEPCHANRESIMKYVLERAFQKLWQNRRVYFFLALELTIGIAVTLCGYLSSRSAQNRIDFYNRQYGSGSMVVEYYTDRNAAKAAITYEDYRDLYNKYRAQCDFTFFSIQTQSTNVTETTK